MTLTHDVVVIGAGAGAAGMMCASQAGQRGRRLQLVEHYDVVGEKIRISGGGRCNFTNVDSGLPTPPWCPRDAARVPRPVRRAVRCRWRSVRRFRVAIWRSWSSACEGRLLLRHACGDASVHEIGNQVLQDAVATKRPRMESRPIVCQRGGCSVHSVRTSIHGYSFPVREQNCESDSAKLPIGRLDEHAGRGGPP
jgi:hypothetical protein